MRSCTLHATQIALLCLLFAVSAHLAWGNTAPQSPTPKPEPIDTFYMKNGKKEAVKFVRMEGDSIYYSFPGKSRTYRMTRNRVLAIVHADGKREELQKAPESSGSQPMRWQDVVVTENKKDIRGMRLIDRYDEKLGSGNIHHRVKASKLKKGAIVQLQRRAALKHATHLYIKRIEFATAFGEPPSVHIEAEAYKVLKLPKDYKLEKH